MIKAVAKSNAGETLVLFGLSELNVQKLKEGLPILVEMEDLGFKGKVAIIYGETEDDLAKQFSENLEVGHLVDFRDPESMQ